MDNDLLDSGLVSSLEGREGNENGWEAIRHAMV